MKKIITGIFAAALLLVSVESNAQLVTGAGYLYASEKTGSDNAIPFHGFYLGASYNIPIVGGLGVAPGLYADMLFHNTSGSAGGTAAGLTLSGRYRELMVNVPLNLNYGINVNSNVKLIAFAGPTFQFGILSSTTISGNVNLNLFGQSYNYSDSETYDYYKNDVRNRFNIYLGGGIGLQIGDIMFTVGYDRNMMDFDKNDNTKTNRNVIKAGINRCF